MSPYLVVGDGDVTVSRDQALIVQQVPAGIDNRHCSSLFRAGTPPLAELVPKDMSCDDAATTGAVPVRRARGRPGPAGPAKACAIEIHCAATGPVTTSPVSSRCLRCVTTQQKSNASPSMRLMES